MPSIFKALTTIIVWILFVFGCLTMALGILLTGKHLPVALLVWVLSIISLMLAMVAMKMSKSLE